MLRYSRMTALRCRALSIGLVVALSALAGPLLPVRADERLEALEEQSFREAAALAATSIVRIETVGGLELVDDVLTPTGPTTGVIVSADGEIMTSSFNFASQPASVLVTTPDGERHAATIVASDEARMLTLLKIEAADLTPLPAVPEAEIQVGQWSIALGRTYELDFPNMSVGIVSALGRIWGRALQTDANVSPLNYGGPLVDVEGRGLGLIVPLSPQSEGETAGIEWYDSGIGFAIPMDDVYEAARRLQSGEDLKPGKLGLMFTGRGPLAGEAVIDRVRPGSPAFDAGLQSGDRIVEVDGRPVARLAQLQSILGQKYAGDTLTLTYLRQDESLTAELTLTDELSVFDFPLMGILPERDTRDEAPEAGVKVRFVLSDTPAADAGIRPRDHLHAIGDTPIKDAATLRELISRHAPGETLEVELLRDGESVRCSVTLGSLTALPSDALPSISIPAPAEPLPDVETGRLNLSLGDPGDKPFWLYVPDDINPDFDYGLVVWVHPSGDSMEAAVLSRWQAVCRQRGLILVGPQALDVAGWTPNDVEFLADVVKHVQELYPIDPTRIVVHALGDAASIACLAAFRERELFRGVSLVRRRSAWSLRRTIPVTVCSSIWPIRRRTRSGKASRRRRRACVSGNSRSGSGRFLPTSATTLARRPSKRSDAGLTVWT